MPPEPNTITSHSMALGSSHKPSVDIVDMASPLYATLANKKGNRAGEGRKHDGANARAQRIGGLYPLSNGKKAQTLSPATRLKWSAEATAAYMSSSLYLALQDVSSASVEAATVHSLRKVTHPDVALASEQATRALLASILLANGNAKCEANEIYKVSTISTPQSSSPSSKLPPIAGTRMSQPLFARPHAKAAVLRKGPPSINRRKVTIEPLLSEEMLEKLQMHLEQKIQGSIWQNEIRSKLARPLSATAFCVAREERLEHPLSAAQYVFSGNEQDCHRTSSPRESSPLFPYSIEAHAWTQQIAKCYTTMRFRVDVLTQVRRVAIAIRIFRRVIVPQIVRWHRARAAAATLLQRFYHHHMQWRRCVLVPQIESIVLPWIELGLRRVWARRVIVGRLERLFVARKKRVRDAIQRHWQLLRWAAKTRVCLFIHQVWTAAWFRKKRARNLQAMVSEVSAMEQLDVRFDAEYHILFNTSMGKMLLKKELTAWRRDVKKTNSSAIAQSGEQEVRTLGEDIDASMVRLRNCFAIFDIDGSGTLDLDKFQLMLSYLRVRDDRGTKKVGTKNNKKLPNLSTAQIRDLFDDLDVDDNGCVTCAEFESWWHKHHDDDTTAAGVTTSWSASASFLTSSLDRIVLQSHGLLFWLLGKKQQLQRKFVKKLMRKRAQDLAKHEFITTVIQNETTPPVRRCCRCGRRFELQRDLNEHNSSGSAASCSASEWIVDTFTLRKWIREEEIRLLQDEP